MNRMLLLFLCILLLIPAGVYSQYQIPAGTFSCGGGVGSGSHISNHTAGQAAVGGITGISGSYRVKSGFWYLAELSSAVEVAIKSFHATYSPDRVELAWSIAQSAQFEGFNIYRREGEEGPFQKLNGELLPFENTTAFTDETALPGRTYCYQLGAVESDGEIFSAMVTLSLPPKPLTLYQNHPNPFNPSTTIAYFLPRDQYVNLSIYDIRGSRVTTLVESHQQAGRKEIIWNGRNKNGVPVSSGVYHYRLVTGKKTITRKMVVIR